MSSLQVAAQTATRAVKGSIDNGVIVSCCHRYHSRDRCPSPPSEPIVLGFIRRSLPLTVLATMLMLWVAATYAQDGAANVPDSSPASPAADTPPADARNDTTESVPLGTVEVRGKRNLFDEQAARRKKLLDDSAPCLGCDATPLVHKPKLLERLANSALNQVTPQAPPEPDDAGKTEHDVMEESRHPTNSNP